MINGKNLGRIILISTKCILFKFSGKSAAKNEEMKKVSKETFFAGQIKRIML